MSYALPECHSRHKKSRSVENVLILQGGGSLGAFGCGVFKALAKSNIKFDIVAGTSIGAINAAIIVGNKIYEDKPEKALEEFWIEIAESNPSVIPDTWIFDYDDSFKRLQYESIPSSSANASIFGVPKMFIPRWHYSYFPNDLDFFMPWTWTFIYDHTPLAKTLDKYIDYKKLGPSRNNDEVVTKLQSSENTENPNYLPSSSTCRLIATAVNVTTAEPLVFDSKFQQIEAKHLLASSGYPVYGLRWVKVDEGIYGWDGALLSNTPVREVIDASPKNDKNIFIVENYPRLIDKLPSNMAEVVDRTRDIIFSDKNLHNIKMSKFITRQIELIEHLYDFFESSDKSNLERKEIAKIRQEYSKLVSNYGAEILSVTRIIKERIASPHPFKNADFSVKAIKELIAQGEQKAMASIKNLNK